MLMYFIVIVFIFFVMLWCKRIPPVNIRVSYALGIITLFPNLKDKCSPTGYVSIQYIETTLSLYFSTYQMHESIKLFIILRFILDGICRLFLPLFAHFLLEKSAEFCGRNVNVVKCVKLRIRLLVAVSIIK